MAQQPAEKPNRAIIMLVQFFTALGVLSIAFGALHLFSMAQGFTLIRMSDALINTLFGLLAFACADLLRRESMRVLFVAAGYVVLSLAYSFAVGRGFNAVGLVLGCLMIGALLTLWQRGDLI
jgi:hypothetical protein